MSCRAVNPSLSCSYTSLYFKTECQIYGAGQRIMDFVKNYKPNDMQQIISPSLPSILQTAYIRSVNPAQQTLLTGPTCCEDIHYHSLKEHRNWNEIIFEKRNLLRITRGSVVLSTYFALHDWRIISSCHLVRGIKSELRRTVGLLSRALEVPANSWPIEGKLTEQLTNRRSKFHILV
jgi:hypothetical protein